MAKTSYIIPTTSGETFTLMSVKKGLKITNNFNGGMGGGRKMIYTYQTLNSLNPSLDSMWTITTLDGHTEMVNPKWISNVEEVRIYQVKVNKLRWNGKFLKECRYFDEQNYEIRYFVANATNEDVVVCETSKSANASNPKESVLTTDF